MSSQFSQIGRTSTRISRKKLWSSYMGDTTNHGLKNSWRKLLLTVQNPQTLQTFSPSKFFRYTVYNKRHNGHVKISSSYPCVGDGRLTCHVLNESNGWFFIEFVSSGPVSSR